MGMVEVYGVLCTAQHSTTAQHSGMDQLLERVEGVEGVARVGASPPCPDRREAQSRRRAGSDLERVHTWAVDTGPGVSAALLITCLLCSLQTAWRSLISVILFRHSLSLSVSHHFLPGFPTLCAMQ